MLRDSVQRIRLSFRRSSLVLLALSLGLGSLSLVYWAVGFWGGGSQQLRTLLDFHNVAPMTQSLLPTLEDSFCFRSSEYSTEFHRAFYDNFASTRLIKFFHRDLFYWSFFMLEYASKWNPSPGSPADDAQKTWIAYFQETIQYLEQIERKPLYFFRVDRASEDSTPLDKDLGKDPLTRRYESMRSFMVEMIELGALPKFFCSGCLMRQGNTLETSLSTLQNIVELEDHLLFLRTISPVPHAVIDELERKVIMAIDGILSAGNEQLWANVSRDEVRSLSSDVVERFSLSPCEKIKKAVFSCDDMEEGAMSEAKIGHDSTNSGVATTTQLMGLNHVLTRVSFRSRLFYVRDGRDFADYLNDSALLWQNIIRETFEEVPPASVFYNHWREDLSACILNRIREKLPIKYRGQLHRFELTRLFGVSSSQVDYVR